MYALQHKKTGNVQFVFNKDAHDLTEWDATELAEEPTEFHRFDKGKLTLDKAAKDKATKASARAALTLTEREDELIAMIEALTVRVTALENK